VRLATWQMTTLFEVGKEISSNLELAPRLKLVTSKAAELSGGRAAVLYLRHEETEECRVAGVHGLELPPRQEGSPHFFQAERAVGLPAFEQRPVRRLAAPPAAPLVLPALAGLEFTSVLAVPMVAEGQSIGLLVALDKQGGFSDDDASFLALYASQAAIAVRNSQLFEHTKTLDRLKSEFVAVVSHEIRTPLTSVKGAVELLADPRYFPNNEQQTKLLTIAHANAERLLVLINDILDFSKLESASLPMSLERSSLAPVVQQAVHNLRTLIEERRIRIEVRVSPALPDLFIDSSRVAQVLTNLLSNAIKFSPPGGEVTVAAEPLDGEVRVSVRDLGEGISAEDLPKLFKKFTQIDSSATRKAGGTGLGLVICKGIVEQHGGKIWVESVSGDGSTFFFTLPYADRGQAVAELPARVGDDGGAPAARAA
jgi:signal transduction histidine kinase